MLCTRRIRMFGSAVANTAVTGQSVQYSDIGPYHDGTVNIQESCDLMGIGGVSPLIVEDCEMQYLTATVATITEDCDS